MLLIKEMTEDVEVDKTNYFIKGIFMQADQKNRNGRVYPSEYLMRDVDRYIQEMVTSKRSLGELGHPDNPSVNLDRVSHIITELTVNGKDIYGKAKIMDTPLGKIAKNFIDEGVKLGVSTRGVGSIVKKGTINEVQSDFMLTAVDIVHDPSAQHAFVEGIMEGKEWIYTNGMWSCQELEEAKKEIQKTPNLQLERKSIQLFEEFMSKLAKC